MAALPEFEQHFRLRMVALGDCHRPYGAPASTNTAYQKSSKEVREAVSDRGRGVRSRGERPPTRGAP
jgi:hypothetical protein